MARRKLRSERKPGWRGVDGESKKLHPTTVGLYEAKTKLSELVGRVERGEVITITRNGQPVARIVTANREITVAERKAAIDRFLEERKGNSLGGLKIRDLIAEGRR